MMRPIPDLNTLRKQYDEFLDPRLMIVRDLRIRIEGVLRTFLPSRPSVKARVKDFASYFKKYIRILKANNSDADPVINDIIGVRIVCPFLEDLAATEEILKDNFQVIEAERKGGDHTFREFGYESIHLLIKIPDEISKISGNANCDTAEIQIRTILQDAWAEVEHELVYKAEFNPFDAPMKRKLAAVNASLSLADIIFQEIRSYQRQLNGELGKRRESFFKKIEDSTDALLFEGEKLLPAEDDSPLRQFVPNESIDELLLNALYAHNKNQFSEAIAFYTRILELKPGDTIAALIYKHRGMAFFARSHYEEAITDFGKALELDPKSYKAAYYQGIILSVLQKYQEAIDAFGASLAINPYQSYCLYRRGQAYYHLEDYPQALADCEAALALENMEPAQKFRQLLLSKLKM
ncbi:RelA/SpoT domain-containing protein [Leadbettera azotonutricia]|uniref:RelA/SpoT domain protein n=1 Tax=Leadbettera azotonutricia (strain ATCC BAA-888 / DSM 13862 / ZAS-9) TaxID=545695 RepID=F5Y6R8_LEAAZ|nr:RelA/SpoT domain-containing protein [Leadbettera azotonutricia]AEF81132.1 RelA/SpoT domain protein [Leadbettera azotonutricia ZAS-9]